MQHVRIIIARYDFQCFTSKIEDTKEDEHRRRVYEAILNNMLVALWVLPIAWAPLDYTVIKNYLYNTLPDFNGSSRDSGPYNLEST